MSSKHYDLIIVGLGIMGAATAWQASQKKASVLAIEVGGPSHRGGSSHGATRIFRQAYWEGKNYLQLLRLADAGWRELEHQTNMKLRLPTGGIFIGSKSTSVVAGSLETARLGGIQHEHFSADDIRSKFPQFAVFSDMEAVFEPGAYPILAEESRLQMLNEAVRNGSHLMYGIQVSEFITKHQNPIIKTISGETITGDAVVICAGAWTKDLLPELQSFIKPHWVPIHWFQPRPKSDTLFNETAFPVFLYEDKLGALLYGFPSGLSSERGVKIGFHNRQHVRWNPGQNPPDIKFFANEIANSIENIFPDLDPNPRDSRWCIYTMSKDESFVIDKSKSHSKIFFASVCSGHGFKFAPAIGKVMSELGLGLALSADIAQFSFSRLHSQ